MGGGAAGPDYGIAPFACFMTRGESPGAEKLREAYRQSLAQSFMPRRLLADEVEEYAMTRKYYELYPEKYSIYENLDENALCDTAGYYVLETHGCQYFT